MTNSNIINLDHSATTPVLEAVWEAMRPFQSAGNPASAHAIGRRARQALEDARERIAARLDAASEEVVFTSGATEANNLAIFGLVGQSPGHILTSAIEHPSVIEPIRELASRGIVVEQLPVQHNGIVDIADLSERIRPETRLIALMRVNHETGAIQPIVPAGSYSWHCDAAQAVGKIPVSFRQLGPTTLALSGHKFGAPPGIGALLVRKDHPLRPMLFGGHQQQGRRPGTEPVALAIGMATALDIASENLMVNECHARTLKTRFLKLLQASAAPIVINGTDDACNCSPYVANVSFSGQRADALLMSLDLAGVACSTGSACSSGSMLPSPVLKAMGVPSDHLVSAMRFSFSPLTTTSEIDDAAIRIAQCVRQIRSRLSVN